MHNMFLQKAKDIKIKLYEKEISAGRICSLVEDSSLFMGCGVETVSTETETCILNPAVIYDLGEHYTGYLSFSVDIASGCQDAPLELKISFAEVPYDFVESERAPETVISYSWIQKEFIKIDEVPCKVCLPRRYACRYVKIENIGTVNRMEAAIKDFRFKAVSSAGFSPIDTSLYGDYSDVAQISVRTLRECMQKFYEDGPKRDRRLWLGDLRLQAISNYAVYGDTELVKKCLYLFAAVSGANGDIPSNMYISPDVHAGIDVLFDYSLMFMVTLSEYYDYSKDRETAEELFALAYKQFDTLNSMLGDDDRITHREGWWCFIDWNDNHGKYLPMTGTALYCINYAEKLAKDLGKTKELSGLNSLRRRLKNGIMSYYNSESGFFEEDGTVSWIGNSFAAMSGVLEREKSIALMKGLEHRSNAVPPVTPYTYHYVLEAYLTLGMYNELKSLINRVWGRMAASGIDTFWEAFSFDDDFVSPYGDCKLNSYCHAWSCSPIYFISKFNNKL